MTEPFHLTWTVPMEPRGKDRPRARVVPAKGKGKPFASIYNTTETEEWEKRFADATWALLGSTTIPKEVPLDVAIVAVFSRPEFMSKLSKRTGTLLGGWLERAYLHFVKPDADNVGKIVLDALSGWFADERVCVLRVHKFIAGMGEKRRVFVRIREATETTPDDVIRYYERK